jgi:hypothetical protein
MNVDHVIEKYGIPMDQTVYHAIWKVDSILDSSSNIQKTIDDIIDSFGIATRLQLIEGRIFVKGLVEYVYLFRDTYSPVDANAYGLAKVDKVQRDMPYLLSRPRVLIDKRAKISGNKKARIKDIIDCNPTLTTGELTKIITKDLNITHANAYYYLKRVFRI